MPKIITTTDRPTLRVPQARVLKALAPKDPASHYTEWPLYNRVTLAKRAGFNPTTGTINRVLHGIPEGSSSGEPHPGLIERGLIKATTLDIDGVMETSYRITALGAKVLAAYLEAVGNLPKKRDKEMCVNDRYQ